jgi:hypothetical protein
VVNPVLEQCNNNAVLVLAVSNFELQIDSLEAKELLQHSAGSLEPESSASIAVARGTYCGMVVA